MEPKSKILLIAVVGLGGLAMYIAIKQKKAEADDGSRGSGLGGFMPGLGAWGWLL